MRATVASPSARNFPTEAAAREGEARLAPTARARAERTRPEDLIAAIHTIAAGDSLLLPSVTRTVIERMARQPVPDAAAGALLDVLTPRELEVLDLIARGLSNGQTADELFVEESTVKTHVRHILRKLRLRDRIQAVIFAYEHGLTGADQP